MLSKLMTLAGVIQHNPFEQCAAYYQRVLQRYDSLVHLILLRPESLDYQEAALSDYLAVFIYVIF